MLPLGTTISPLILSKTTVFHSAFVTSIFKSLARKNLSRTNLSPSGFKVIKNGKSVYFLAYS